MICVAIEGLYCILSIYTYVYNSNKCIYMATVIYSNTCALPNIYAFMGWLCKVADEQLNSGWKQQAPPTPALTSSSPGYVGRQYLRSVISSTKFGRLCKVKGWTYEMQPVVYGTCAQSEQSSLSCCISGCTFCVCIYILWLGALLEFNSHLI